MEKEDIVDLHVSENLAKLASFYIENNRNPNAIKTLVESRNFCGNENPKNGYSNGVNSEDLNYLSNLGLIVFDKERDLLKINGSDESRSLTMKVALVDESYNKLNNGVNNSDIGSEVKEIFQNLENPSETIPYDSQRTITSFRALERNGKGKILNNLLYGNTAVGYGHMPSQPVGGDFEQGYCQKEPDKN